MNDTLYCYRSTDDESVYTLATCSNYSTRASTNATADNLPGPGRNLGRLYNYLGKKLEVQIGKFAEKVGKGPRMTAVRIQRVRSKTMKRVWPRCKNYDARCAQIEKCCEKLIRYIGSDMISTKLDALEQITRLAIEDDWVRNVLLVKGAVIEIQSLRRWDPAWVDIRPTLLPRCHKALVSLTDTEINTLAMQLEWALDHGPGDALGPLGVGSCARKLSHFLSHPDRAFLVIRHVARLFIKWDRIFFVNHITDCFRNIPLDASIEWDLLDDLFMKPASVNIFNWTNPYARYYDFGLVLRVPDRLPKTIHAPVFQGLARFDGDDDVDPWHAHETYKLLKYIADMTSIDDITRIDFGLLKRLYPHPDVDELLHRISCPPDALLCKILDSMHPYWEKDRVFIEPQILAVLIPRLAIYVDSDDGFLQQRALRASSYLLSNNIYSRKATMNALSSTQFGGSPDYHKLMQSTELKCVPPDGFREPRFFRHCDVEGHLFHIGPCKYALCRDRGGSIQILEFSQVGVVEFHISRGRAFSASSHHPILAGITTAGEKAYVASARSKNRYYRTHVSITNDTKPENLPHMRDEPRGQHFMPHYLTVFALRHEPNAYVRSGSFSEDGEIGSDPTGPFSWKPCEESAELDEYESDEYYGYDSDSTEENYGGQETSSGEGGAGAIDGDSHSAEHVWDLEEAEEEICPTSSVDTFYTCFDTSACG